MKHFRLQKVDLEALIFNGSKQRFAKTRSTNYTVVWTKCNRPMDLKGTDEVLREQIYVLFNTEDFNFRPVEKGILYDSNSFQCSHMMKPHFRNNYKNVHHQILLFQDENVIFNNSESST